MNPIDFMELWNLFADFLELSFNSDMKEFLEEVYSLLRRLVRLGLLSGEWR